MRMRAEVADRAASSSAICCRLSWARAGARGAELGLPRRTQALESGPGTWPCSIRAVSEAACAWNSTWA
eukprot:1905217-Alexandrium_andersonii.AAC.1